MHTRGDARLTAGSQESPTAFGILEPDAWADVVIGLWRRSPSWGHTGPAPIASTEHGRERKREREGGMKARAGGLDGPAYPRLLRRRSSSGSSGE